MTELESSEPSIQLVSMAVVDLLADPRNARAHSQRNLDVIRASLRRYGQVMKIVIRSDGTCIAGSGLLAAAKAEGWERVDVKVFDGTHAEAVEYGLIDNRSAELAEWDLDVLPDLLAGLDVDTLLDVGWTEDELQDILAEVSARSYGTDPELPPNEDDLPELRPDPIAKLGDIWRCGQHRVMCGDSTDPAVIESVMGGEKADLVWTDPPYGVAYQEDMSVEEAKIRHRRTDGLVVSNDGASPVMLDALLRAAFGNAVSVCKPGAGWFVAGPPGPLQTIPLGILNDMGILRQTLIWVKDALVMGRSDYHYRHEPIAYGWVPGAAHTAPPDRTGDSVWEIPRPTVSKDHPTMKPVALVTRAITNHTAQGAVVLDPFAGSGTTMIAAHTTGRVARVVELDPQYVDVICRRYEGLTGEAAVLAE